MAEEPPCAFTCDYDDFVDWDKRLAREGPFFRELFEGAGVRSVIDVGAGNARHAIMFATWGLHVTAVDPDDSMLEQARGNLARFAEDIAAGGGSVSVVRGGFGELVGLGLEPADALVSTGNALPHVAGRPGLSEAVADFAAVLKPGGVIVLHLLNYARLIESRPRAIPPKIRETPAGTKVFLRVIDYPPGDEFVDFDFVTLARDASGGWQLASRRSQHAAITAELLMRELAVAGFADVHAYGDHGRRPLDVAGDESVILTATRR